MGGATEDASVAVEFEDEPKSKSLTVSLRSIMTGYDDDDA
jgi:hypothetical protein